MELDPALKKRYKTLLARSLTFENGFTWLVDQQ